MLQQKNRLIKKKDFEMVHRYGKSFYFENIILKARKNGLNETRIGFLVGIKFSKKAVERNRIKRQLREVFREFLGDIEKGMDIAVIVGKNKKNKIDFQDLREIIKKVLEKGNLIVNKR